MIEFISRGGVFLVPIGALSIAALYLIIERASFFLKSRPTPQVLASLNRILGDKDVDVIDDVLKRSQAPEARLVNVGLHPTFRKTFDPRLRLERTLLSIVTELEQNVGPLAAIANVSTHLGLLGTVVGMIAAFIGMGGVATADMTGLTRGISQALVTTAAGLGVAVPSSFFHHVYANYVKKRIAELNVTVAELEPLLSTVPGDERRQ